MSIWIKHPRKKEPDTMLTLAVFAFVTVATKFILNGASIGTVDFGTTDAAMMAALLTPTLGAYWARKHTDKTTQKTEEK